MSDAAAPEAPHLRVCTFNIRFGLAPDGLNSWRFRRRSTLATLRTIGADVVGLQESHDNQLAYLLDRLPEYRHTGVGRRRDERREHCPILYRAEQFTLVGGRTLWFSDDPTRAGSKLPRSRHPRIATFARFAGEPLDTEIEVINTHLDERHADNRRRSVELLASWLDGDMPRVVMGDFNARPGEVLRPLLDAGFVLAHGEQAGATFHAFGQRKDGPQIDHVLVSRHWRVVHTHVMRDTPGCRLPSDHWPVVADLALPS